MAATTTAFVTFITTTATLTTTTRTAIAAERTATSETRTLTLTTTNTLNNYVQKSCHTAAYSPLSCTLTRTVNLSALGTLILFHIDGPT